jgi:hypothetical protein
MRAEQKQPAPTETLAPAENRVTYEDWIRITGKDPSQNPPGEMFVNSLVVCCKGFFALACIAAAGTAVWLGYTLAAG